MNIQIYLKYASNKIDVYEETLMSDETSLVESLGRSLVLFVEVSFFDYAMHIVEYSWVPNRRVYSFIWHQRNMKKETDTKTDKSI